MPTVNARSASGPGAAFEKTTIERRELGPHDVLIDVAYAGICHSDIHTARGEWGETLFPLVPGHEIAGTVSAVGAEVTRFRSATVPASAAWSTPAASAPRAWPARSSTASRATSAPTTRSARTVCRPSAATARRSSSTRTTCCSIPEGISLDVAAPLLCAGITLYSPLKRWGAGPGKKVAIVGMGGLGHMGVKIATALGAEVSVLSQSLKKQEDGLRLGADHFYATSDEGTLEQLAGTFDLIVSTISATVDMGDYLGLLKLDGALVNVGAPEEPLSVPAFALIGGRRSLAGSMIGGIRETQEMLDFCAEHGLGAEVEVIAADEIDEAYDRVVASDVRYRFVIDAATIAG